MAKVYLEKLSQLIHTLNIQAEVTSPIEVKHFFSGAAFYCNSIMCASWSPVGLAFKLSEGDIETLFQRGKAIPLKYFPTGHIKKGYALFESPGDKNPVHWKKYFLKAIQHQ